MKNLSIVAIIVISACLLTACGSKANVPDEVAAAAQSNWEYYSWSENLGSDLWRGGGWHLADADKNEAFSVTGAVKGAIPAELQVLMSMGMTSYSDEVWCLNFEPTLYFGYGDIVNEDISSKNFLMFQQSNGNWSDLGAVWNEPWVNFYYPPNTYKFTTNFYMGVDKSMFELVGCDNWQE